MLSHLFPSSAFPGLGPFVRDEAIELAKRNTVAVLSPLQWSPMTFRSAARVRSVPKVSVEDGIEIVRPRLPAIPIGGLNVDSRLWALRLEPLLRRMQSRIGADVIHAHFALPDGFAAAHYATRAGVPLVLTLWGSDVMRFGRTRSLRTLLTRTFGKAQAIIAVSEELADRAEALGARRERLKVIPGGVPYRPAIPKADARARLEIDSAACVLWVGGLVAIKQPLQAIEAFEHVDAADSRELLLAMIGNGPLSRDVQDYVRRRGLGDKVRLLGHREREYVWMWQCAADVLVNSSLSEGTPIAVLEALGAGTPVAAYRVGGVGAALDAVAGGTLAVENTPAGLAAAIATELAVGRARDQLAQRARIRFDISQTVRAIESVYDAVTTAAPDRRDCRRT